MNSRPVRRNCAADSRAGLLLLLLLLLQLLLLLLLSLVLFLCPAAALPDAVAYSSFHVCRK